MKTASVVLGLAVLLSSDFATAQPQPGTPNPTLQQQPGKPHRVVDLKSGSFVIDAPGDWVLNRSWSLEYRGDMPLNVIDVVADNVVLDFRGFTVQVSNTRDIARVTLINVQGRVFTLKNAVVRIGDGAQSSALRSTGDATTIENMSGFSFDGIALQGHSAVIRNSAFFVRDGIGLSTRGTIENTFIGCSSGCVGFLGDENKLLNSRIRPAEFSGLTILGNGNLLAGNVLDFPEMGPELQTGFNVRGDANVLRNNTLVTGGETLHRREGFGDRQRPRRQRRGRGRPAGHDQYRYTVRAERQFLRRQSHGYRDTRRSRRDDSDGLGRQLRLLTGLGST